jgi:hypothetical protein
MVVVWQLVLRLASAASGEPLVRAMSVEASLVLPTDDLAASVLSERVAWAEVCRGDLACRVSSELAELDLVVLASLGPDGSACRA